MKRCFSIIFLVSVLNFWFWRIVKLDTVTAALILPLSILLSFSLVNKISRKILLLMISLMVIISYLSLAKGADRGLFRVAQLEISTSEKRHEYYAKELGGIYKNRIGIFYLKKYKPLAARIEKNLFSSLDLNLYFFASHPRERGGVGEFEKYPFIYLPVFILGLIVFLKNPKKLIILYFITATVTNIFLHPAYILGPILFYPLINAILFLGVLGISELVRNYEI